MNLSLVAACELAAALADKLPRKPQVGYWIAPSYPAIAACAAATKGSSLLVGGQNVHGNRDGAFTGEISVGMLQDLGAKFAIVGHSERRHIMGEGDGQVAMRATGALSQGLRIIFCIGETLNERESGQTETALRHQLLPFVQHLQPQIIPLLTLAYEPVWAIGTGHVATDAQISNATLTIAEIWESICKPGIPCPPILYGGSVDPSNFRQICGVSGVGGALIGGASLSVEKFCALAAIAEEWVASSARASC